MTHIIEVSKEELENLKSGKKFSLIKAKREIKTNDAAIFENGTQQYPVIVTDVQTHPGLMKGWVLLTLEH